MANRLIRELNTRDKKARAKTWTPPTQLPDPKPEEGFSFRWVRVAILGQDDPRNVSMRLREGWEPVKAEDHPELVAEYGLVANVNKSGNIENGGLMLCKIPSEIADSRNEYYSKLNKQQAESVDNNFMRENNPRMPLFSEKRTTVSRGSK